MVEETNLETPVIEEPTTEVETTPEETSEPKEEEIPEPSADLITNKSSEDDYFRALFIQMDQEEVELMKSTPIQELSEVCDPTLLDKDAVLKHRGVRVSIYLQKIEDIYIKNPILIKLNQEMVPELKQKIIESATADEEFANKKNLAATLQQIQKLKNEISSDNVSGILEQEEEILRQLKKLSMKI